MTAMVVVWAKFSMCAALIGFAGPVLTRYGDIIARRTGVSRTWIGLLLLATATSLPELFTGVSAVTVAAAPNIAVGDALGSCVFNLAMLVVLDAMHRGEPMYSRMDQGHILTAGFGVILIGFAGASLLLARCS
jgi:cation:H+ antiporter